LLTTSYRFRIGLIDGEWTNFVPPIQGGVFRRAIEAGGDTKTSPASDNTLDATSVSRRPQAASCTSEELQPELVATKQTAVCSGKFEEIDVPEPQATTGWKLVYDPDSYTAIAVQQAIDADVAKYPSLDADTQRGIAIKFRALHQRVHDEGYYQCSFSNYASEVGRYLALFGLFLTLLHYEWYICSAVALGIFWQQIMFTAHDAGHCGITHNYVIDSLIGIFIGNFVCGLSIGWWKSSHNVHHFVTNDPVSSHSFQYTSRFWLIKCCRYTIQTHRTSPCSPHHQPSSAR
jgi:delta8-fatty-acid desaturase